MPDTFNLQGMYDWAVAMCSRTDVAYDQSYRNYQTRPSDGKICFDCSSFTFFACWLGGGLDIGAMGYPTDLSLYQSGRANAWVVTSMINKLTGAGWYQYSPQTEPWRAGDILAKTRTHCEICYAPPRQTMGAHNSSRGVTINDYQADINYYDVLLRYPRSEPGPTPPGPSLPMPIWLIKRAIENSRGW